MWRFGHPRVVRETVFQSVIESTENIPGLVGRGIDEKFVDVYTIE